MDREQASKGDSEADARCARRKRAAAAWSKRDEWQKVLSDVYDFVAPHRLSTRWAKKTPAAKSMRMFDNTAAVAWMRAAGRLQQDLFPPGEPFGRLEPGPAVAALGHNEDDARRELQLFDNQVQPAFLNGDFDQAVHETFLDAQISTGFMLVLEGDHREPVRFVNVSLDEMAVENGPFNKLEGYFWKSKWTYRQIAAAYPKGNFDTAFREKLEHDGGAEVTFCQDVVFDRAAYKWRLFCYVEGEDSADIWSETSFECPFIGVRIFRLPGEAMGYGPALLNLPTTKTLNKAVELTLKSAAMAMAGIYTRIDDGVFDPDTARIEPGAFWAVARNGGPLGPSIQRLQTASDPNLANLALQDLRMMTQAGYNDQQLPPDGQSPRSAAEIVERVKRLGQDWAGAYGRLVHDMVIPLYRRTVEVLWRQGVIHSRLQIDQLLVQLRVVSPLGSAFKVERAKRYVDWVQACGAVGGPEFVHMVTPLEQGLARVGHDMGVDADLVYTIDEQTSIQNSIKAGVAAALAQQAKAAQQQAAPNGDPAQAAA